MIDHIDAGDEAGAAEVMVDYWSAPGTFQTIPQVQQAKITYGIRAATEKARKVLADPAEHTIDASQFQAPTLVLSGAASPRSARGVTDILARNIGCSHLHRIDDVGHMAPLTQEAQVNALIEKHIEAHTN
jgi:lipase